MKDRGNGDALILVVDDDPAARVLARAALEQIGLRVEEAADGHEALRLFEEVRPDLLLLDMVMPGMDGFATCAELRATPGGDEIPVLVMTALDDVDSLARAYDAGATDFIGKPVRHVVLQHRVRYMLRATHTTSQLRDSRRRLARAQRIAGLAHWEWDPREDTLRLSEQFELVLGCRPEGSGGPFEGEWVHPRDRERVQREFREAMSHSRPVSLEHCILLPDGAERHVSHQAEPVADRGGERWVGTLQDITESIELRRRLMHADRLIAVGQLAAGVAHEVNNPASFVLVNLGLMQEHLESLEAALVHLRCGRRETVEGVLAAHDVDSRLDEVKEMLRENLEGMDRIVGIVKDLSTFSRVEQDDLEEVDINEVVQAACNMTANEIRHCGNLIQDLESCPTVRANRGKMAQVATNLLINAAHAIRDAKRASNAIRVSTRHVNDRVVLRVEDTGAGIPGALRDRIFDPFFTTKCRGQGSGLGLSLSADIVRKHGGELRLVRSSEEGSLFEVALPASSRRGTSATREHASTPGPGRQRILLVDDEPALLRSFSRSLGRSHDLVAVCGGDEALATLERDAAFDVVICDLMMPRIDGIAVYRWIEDHHPTLRKRVIFYTGGAFTPRAKEFVGSVDNPVLPKPIDWTRLNRLIAAIGGRGGP